ncbi:MAG: hypothetical protein KGO03_11770, partial [Gemmatimonadota bacterium]|nr:hypothetical protein [Gemmatimonadota bacterium]
MLRSVAGILAGCILVFLLSLMANAVVLHGGPAPTLPPLLLTAMLLLMHALAGTAGGYLAGLVAGRRPGTHGFAVGVLFLLVVQVAAGPLRTAAHPVGAQPFWFRALLLGLVVVGTTLGGAARGEVAGTG